MDLRVVLLSSLRLKLFEPPPEAELYEVKEESASEVGEESEKRQEPSVDQSFTRP